MGDRVNLRQFRKRRLRDDKERSAAENRARSGRDKAEKALERAERKRSETALDGAWIERDDSADPDFR
ncbi:DUF4169 family protein [Jiella mangrovi]|uniref:DUF4169 family protein n=1 Tax=Jiella mangrovi TaxID=2821407 RepID=A0ABS4BFW6_9HYPH|nr:DUF4169 family protein [Jiella mangrovi]MBP0614944.1 DUF4169 family protein [Jiella mangrovi]